MVEDLIQIGESLNDKYEEAFGIKYFKTLDFEKWVSKAILYLEERHKNSSLTIRAKEGYEKLNQNNNYEYYLFLLGSLKASEEVSKREAEAMNQILDLNDLDDYDY